MNISELLFVLFAGATLVQLVFWWGIFARLAWYKGDSPASAATPPLSVIICARNEESNLEKYLPAILDQQYPAFEVLVVDDDSSDGTSRVLAGFQKKYTHLRVLRVSPKTKYGKKYALALGIAAATREYLVFTDADCQPASPFWLRHLASHFEPAQIRPEGSGQSVPVFAGISPEGSGSTILLGYAPYRVRPGLLNHWIRFETVQTAMQYFSFALAGWPYMGVGRNLAWEKALFNQVGGFAAHEYLLSGDDDLFVNAAAQIGRVSVCLEPSAFVFSEAASDWAAWRRQKRRHLGAGRLYRPEHQIALGLLALTHIAHYFLFISMLLTPFGTISVAFYALRISSAFVIHLKILRRLREEHLFIWFPLLDAVLAIYYAVFVPLVLIRSKHLISWK